MTTLTVPARFRGPPSSGNGGWTSGALAEASGFDPVTVRAAPMNVRSATGRRYQAYEHPAQLRVLI